MLLRHASRVLVKSWQCLSMVEIVITREPFSLTELLLGSARLK